MCSLWKWQSGHLYDRRQWRGSDKSCLFARPWHSGTPQRAHVVGRKAIRTIHKTPPPPQLARANRTRTPAPPSTNRTRTFIQHSLSPSLPIACRDRLSPPRYKPDAHLSPSRTNRTYISPRRVQTGRTSLPRAPFPLPFRGARIIPRRDRRAIPGRVPADSGKGFVTAGNGEGTRIPTAGRLHGRRKRRASPVQRGCTA
jgi:hypothetical protein